MHSLSLQNQLSSQKVNEVGLTLIPFVNATGYFSPFFTADELGAELLRRSRFPAFSASFHTDFAATSHAGRSGHELPPKRH